MGMGYWGWLLAILLQYRLLKINSTQLVFYAEDGEVVYL